MSDFVSQRTNASQAFDLEELKAILDREAKRPTILSKRYLKLVDYSLVEEWLNLIGIETNPFLVKNNTKVVTESGNEIKDSLSKLSLAKLKKGDEKLLALFTKITFFLAC